MIEQSVRGRDAARHVTLVRSPHQEQVGRRQHRHSDPGIRQAAADLGQMPMLDGRSLVT